jgi:hypothetical protein
VTAPTNRSLDRLFDRAVKATVLECGVRGGRALGGPPLLEVRAAELDALRRHLRIREAGPSFRCMCLGDLAIELEAEGEVLPAIGLHHGISVRLDQWSSDAELIDGRELLRWLADRGVEAPLASFDEAARQREHDDRVYRRWLETAPPTLAGRLDALLGPMGLQPPAGAPVWRGEAQRLIGSHGSAQDAAMALLRWWGPREGTWQSFPSYEGVAEALLLALGVEASTKLLERDELEDEVLIGIARLLTSWAVMSQEKPALARIGDGAWSRLTEVVGRTRGAPEQARLAHTVAQAREHRAAREGGGPRRTAEGAELVALADHGSLRAIAVGDGGLIALDGSDLVRFVGRAPQILHAGHEGGVIAAAGPRAYVARYGGGGVIGLRVADPRAPSVIATSPGRIVALAASETVIGYHDREAAIVGRVDPDGSAQATVRAEEVRSLQAHGDDLYWLAGSGRGLAVMRWPRGTVLPAEARRLEIDALANRASPALAVTTGAWWVTDPAAARVWRVDDAGEAKVVWRGRAGLVATGVVADDEGAYLWARSEKRVATILAISKDGSTVRPLAREPMRPGDVATLALDDERVYWASGNRILAVRRP